LNNIEPVEVNVAGGGNGRDLNMPSEQDQVVEQRGDFSNRKPPAFKEGKWSVSPFNFDQDVLKDMKLPKRVTLMDMTLGRGIQLPGVGFTPRDEIAVAKALSRAGVPEINAWVLGQNTSRESLDALTSLSLKAELGVVLNLGTNTSGASLKMGTYEEGIDLMAELGVDFVELPFRPIPGLLRFQAAFSEGSMEDPGTTSLDKLLEDVQHLIGYAKEKGIKIRVQLSDAAQIDLPYLLEFAEVAWKARADVIGIGDHNGIGPAAFKFLVGSVKAAVPEAVIAVHTHNLVGLAVADAIAAVEAGAEVVDVSVNAVASTGGQADLAVMAVALEAYYGVETGIDLEQLTDLYGMVSRASGFPTPKLAPLVGEYAYSAIGISQEEFDPYMMNPVLPSTVGNKVLFSPNLCMEDWVISKKLQDLGFEGSPKLVKGVGDAMRDSLKTRKTPIEDDEIRHIVKYLD